MIEVTESEDEVLDAAKPLATLDELCDLFLPTVAARIWQTCCWSARMADGWKIGDFKFLVIAVSPEPHTQLYVQFWSEPGEPVVAEVCSGEWSPGAVKYVQQRQRLFLKSLGYQIGGNASNFGKQVSISSVSAAEDLAREALRIFFEAFGYRGQWPLKLTPERGERAGHAPVYASLTPEDLTKALVAHGFDAKVADGTVGPILLVQRGRRRFTAILGARIPAQNLYAGVTMHARLRPPRAVTDRAIVAMNAAVPGLTVHRAEGPEVQVSMALRFDGGVTEQWIVESLKYWVSGLRHCERLLRDVGGRAARRTEDANGQPRVH